MKTWIVIDLDGTLCDCSHRVHWAQAQQWDQFHAGIPDDKPREDAVTFVTAVSDRYNLALCTGRDVRHAKATWAWLKKHNLDTHFIALLMRPEGDHSPDHELKPKLLAEYLKEEFGEDSIQQCVLLVLEDRDKVVEAWRNLGMTCWQVQAGSY